MVPGHARGRHVVVTKRLEKLKEYAETTVLNVIENNGSKIGIISGGIAYQYAKEVLPGADYLKLGFSYPLPMKKISDFIASHDQVIVIEELEPFYEDQMKAIKTRVKERFVEINLKAFERGRQLNSTGAKG